MSLSPPYSGRGAGPAGDPTASPFAAPTAASAQPRTRMVILLVLVGLCSAVLCAALLLRMIGEESGNNSYALLAQAFLDGHFYVTDCFDIDCAVFEGRHYVVFPPGPALLAMPFVLLFGLHFSGFVAISALLVVVSLWMWRRILDALRLEQATVAWFLIAIAFATPLYYVTLRGEGVWFLAQTCAFLFVTAAIYCALVRNALWLAGACIALAFLCRQMSVFYLPFLFVLCLRADQPLISFRRENVAAALKLALPVAAAVLVYLAYNYVRFGDPLNSGYAYIATGPDDQTVLTLRSRELGLFSTDYVLFNLLYTFVQGFHADFAGRYLTELVQIDPFGTSLIAASPFVLLAFFTRWDRVAAVGLLTIGAIVAIMLFYHSNGFSQYNVQRYALDWLPIVFILLAFAVRPVFRPMFALLVTYGVALNMVTVTLLFLTEVAGNS